MTDRIRELIKEAGNKDALARMIVRDCAELVYNDLDATAPKLAVHLEALILEHFGVEK